MKALLNLLKLNFNLTDIKQQPILNFKKQVVGYHSYAQNVSEQTLSGGTHSNKDISLRICIAELLERYYFKQICDSSEFSNIFLINEFPSTSGFAAGFDNDSTQFRAICEAVERWAWSQWIDHHMYMESDNNIPTFNSLSSALVNDFERYNIYTKEISLKINSKTLKLNFLVFLGFKESGVFAGSRVSTKNDELLEHAAVEANRNLKNSFYFQQKPEKIDKNSFFDCRLMFFSKNADAALDQIKLAKIKEWPQPEVLLLQDYITNENSVFVWRCLMKNFIGWHIGDEKRFVY